MLARICNTFGLYSLFTPLSGPAHHQLGWLSCFLTLIIALVSKRTSGGDSWGEMKDMLSCEKESSVPIQAMGEEDMESGDAYSFGENGQHLQAQKFGGILRSQNLRGHLLRYLRVMCPSPRFSQFRIIHLPYFSF